MTIEKFGANAKTAAALPSIKREHNKTFLYLLIDQRLTSTCQF
jgi:hypothetical protein